MEPLNGKAVLLRIFLGESDHWEGKELYEAIVMKARSQGLAGSTVLRGILSYGANKHWHAAKLLDLSADLPIVVEIVDGEAKINAFLPTLDEMIDKTGCLVTLEDVRIYKHQAEKVK